MSLYKASLGRQNTEVHGPTVVGAVAFGNQATQQPVTLSGLSRILPFGVLGDGNTYDIDCCRKIAITK